MFDPYQLIPDVMVRNVETGEEQKFSQHRLTLGVNTKFEVGKFYENPQVATFNYCDRSEDDTATLYVLENFQMGVLWQAQIRIKTKYAIKNVPVTDEDTIRRLERRLTKLKNLQRQKHKS
jgi:hypothetical protein